MGAATLEALGSSGLETGLHFSHPGLAVSLPHLQNHLLCVPIFAFQNVPAVDSSLIFFTLTDVSLLFPSPSSVMFTEFCEYGSHLPSCTRSPKGPYFAEGCRKLYVTPDEGLSKVSEV